MLPKEIIIKALARERKHERGLRVIAPGNNLAAGHVTKANHNLVVMTDLSKLGHSDWILQHNFTLFSPTTSPTPAIFHL